MSIVNFTSSGVEFMGCVYRVFKKLYICLFLLSMKSTISLIAIISLFNVVNIQAQNKPLEVSVLANSYTPIRDSSPYEYRIQVTTESFAPHTKHLSHSRDSVIHCTPWHFFKNGSNPKKRYTSPQIDIQGKGEIVFVITKEQFIEQGLETNSDMAELDLSLSLGIGAIKSGLMMGAGKYTLPMLWTGKDGIMKLDD